MSQELPFEFGQLDVQVEGMPSEVVLAFRYSLAELLVEAGRLSHLSNGDESARFRTLEGAEFELSNPRLPAAQAQMVKEHLRWLLNL